MSAAWQGQPGGHREEMRPEEMRAVAWRLKDKLWDWGWGDRERLAG